MFVNLKNSSTNWAKNVRRFKKYFKNIHIYKICLLMVQNVDEFKNVLDFRECLKICKSGHEFEKCSGFQICARV